MSYSSAFVILKMKQYHLGMMKMYTSLIYKNKT